MEHGTRYAWYKGGCRCDECREGRRAADYARRQRRFERAKADPSIIPHGSLGYADYGCRCEVCGTANREDTRRQRGNQPAKTWTPEQIEWAVATYATHGPTVAAQGVDAGQGTVRKWAKERGVTYTRPPIHGTRSAYSHRGCRCEVCVDGNRRINAAGRAKLRSKKDQAPHGTATGYVNWGCRCDSCKKAGSIQNAKVRARRIARQSSSGPTETPSGCTFVGGLALSVWDEVADTSGLGSAYRRLLSAVALG